MVEVDMRYAEAFSKLTSKCFVPQKATSSPAILKADKERSLTAFHSVLLQVIFMQHSLFFHLSQ